MTSSLRALLILLVAAVAAPAAAAPPVSPEGLWRTEGPRPGEPGGLVRIYGQNGLYFGRIEPGPPGREPVRRCTACTDERKDQPFGGLVIMRNLRPVGDGYGYEGGDILDPETGRIYSCLLRVEPDGKSLVIRGYFGWSLLGRSQVWRRE